MTKSQTIGIAAVFAAILAVVSWSAFHQASAGTGIMVRQAETKRTEPIGRAAGSSSSLRGDAGSAALNGGSETEGSDTSFSPPGTRPAPGGQGVPAKGEAGIETPRDAPAQPPGIVVQVAGAVKKPGVYHLRADARNDDAVKAAGGLASDANAASVNLAAHAADGSQLYVKTRKEQPVGGADEAPAAISPMLGAVTGAKPAAALRGHRAPALVAKGAAAGKPAKLKSPSEGKININTASAEELQKISGIGPSMAEKIIAYRQENQGFKSVDDLMQVSGIGAKKFAKMAPFVKIH